jgi:hypothetical protein
LEPKAKTVDTPLEAIRTSKQFVFFAVFLREAVLRGAITPANFSNEIVEGPTTLRWPVEARTQEALERWTLNTVLAAMAISAQATDRALDDAFGTPRPLDWKPPPSAGTMSDRDAARVIMYMLRNAYAHEPMNPRWQCKGAYVGVFRVKALGFTLDTTALDGQPWNIAHVAGELGYFRLLEYCEELVRTLTPPS